MMVNDRPRLVRVLLDVKNKTERILNVAPRNFRILVDDLASGGNQILLCSLQIRHQKVKNRTRLSTLLDVKTERARLEPNDSWTLMSHWKSQGLSIELNRFIPLACLNDH